MASTGRHHFKKRDKIWINFIICAKMKVLVKRKVKLFTIPWSFDFYTPLDGTGESREFGQGIPIAHAVTMQQHQILASRRLID